MRRIVRRDPPPGGPSLGDAVHPVLGRIYRSRDIAQAGELDLGLRHLLPFHELGGLEAARELLIGHFDFWAGAGTVMFRQALPLNGGAEPTGQQLEYLLQN